MNFRRKKNRVVMITGASAGLGRAIAREFAKEQAWIGLIARGEEGLENAKKEIEAKGGRALVFPIDVSDAKAVEQAATELEDQFGGIDVWVNNAMVSVFSPVREMTPDEYKRVTEVTYLGYVYGTLSALKRMSARNRGVIIQAGSALAERSIPLQSAYCAAKHAIEGFTESLRTELLHEKSRVQVCLVNLPAMNTTQFSWVRSRLPNKPQPVPPIYQPEVIARAIHHVSKHPRRKLNVAFSTILASNGEKIAPAFADWYLARNGYKAQQTDEPEPENRPDNLWHPIPGDAGSHGSFDQKSRNFSLSLWIDLNRKPLFFGALALTGLSLLFRKELSRKLGASQSIEKTFPKAA